MTDANSGSSTSRFDFWTAVVVGTSLFSMLVILSFWPYTQKWFGLDHEAVKVSPLGAVTKVTYVGGFWINTQIDTAQGSFLLRGAAPFPAQFTLELRQQGGDARVCIEGKELCWLVMYR